MISHIIQVSSKKSFLVVFATCLLLFAGCATKQGPPPAPKMSQIQIRQLQTREYDVQNETSVIKAVIAALQDEGFIISTANPELGLITAAMEVRDEDKATKGWAEFWYGPGMGTYQTTKRFEASATVQKHKNVIRVRINIVAKAITNAGGIVWSQPVYDAKIYQNIFAKVDKSLFLIKEDI